MPKGVVNQALHLASFWMAGFEGADHVNGLGHPLDMGQSNRHIDMMDADYARAAQIGMNTVRESVGWRLSERPDGCIDLARALRCARVANRRGVQVIWSLMHYGIPADLLIGDEDFVPRFARFARTVARALKPLTDQPPIYNPINEIGFMAWAVSATNLIHPYRADSNDGSLSSGFEAKRRLVEASLAAMKAILEEDPRARFLHIEPVVHVAPPQDRPDMQELATQIRDYQWQSWDLLSGRICPEVGGHPAALDLIGVNHYASSQWETGTQDRISWHLKDPRWMPLSSLLQEVWQRYRRPLLVAETSHVGEGRAAWMHDIGQSAVSALQHGVDLRGVCLYPAVDRHDWSDPTHWHHSGLWNVELAPDALMSRSLHFGYAKALRRWQRRVERLTDCPGL